MLTTSTHDSKRSEDSRLRIAALSEEPERWDRALRRFAALNRKSRGLVDGRPAPSRNDEYAIYQTLVGVWPDEEDLALDELRQRVRGWAIKAVREAKIHSSWIVPDEAYEQATTAFLEAILAQPQGAFLREFLPLQRWAAGIGRMSALSQTLLKLTAPGVPDIYQGHETTALALVDPDNRRPVDFERRRRALTELGRIDPAAGEDATSRVEELMHSARDGRAKLWVHRRALELRRRNAELFKNGGYEPLEPSGARAAHVVAFARALQGHRVISVAPRLFGALCDPQAGRYPVGDEVWKDTRIEQPAGAYRDVLTGRMFTANGSLHLSQVLSAFPVALLESIDL